MTRRPGQHAGWVERLAESLGLIEQLSPGEEPLPPLSPTGLSAFPPDAQWDDWTEYDARSWPERRARHRMLVPTTCFNCESACGLLAYVDRETLEIQRFEGNPRHPASRGRTCAKGPATINQVHDADRILYPLRRKGPRGSGEWERVGWDTVLSEIGGRIARAFREGRGQEVIYHVGRPGHEGYMDRVLKAWGIDGHNSHTNVCSGAARLGYALWQKYDRPSPDYAHARFILLISAHLESGHYFNPHAQRIIEGMQSGAELAVLDPRLSNTASMATHWLPTRPGSEAAVLLAMARVLLAEGRFDRDFVREWVNWRAWMAHRGQPGADFDAFVAALLEHYAEFTPEFAAAESGVPAAQIVDVARRVGAAGSRFAAHTWRSAGSGNLGGWCVARALQFLSVLTGSVGTKGGTLPAGWNKFVPTFFDNPPPQKVWNDLHYPPEWPLCHYEMSFVLPHLLREGRGRLDTYFTRVFNPVWTYPDGFAWIEMLSDESKVGCHIALTPTWNETAFYADWVLPMGHGPERHDLNSYETHDGVWIAFRQPVRREALRRLGKPVQFTYEANPGEVWEEDEFWIQLSWRLDADGQLGIRRHFESPLRKGQAVSVEEYYAAIFDKVPGLPEAARAAGLDPLGYMRRFGAFEVRRETSGQHREELPAASLAGARTTDDGRVLGPDGALRGIHADGAARRGFPTPSGRLEFFSPTMAEWGWPEHAVPGYVHSHVHPERLDAARGEFVLLPTFRLPNLIHSRSGNSKWLTEISHRNPVWINAADARALGLKTDDLVRLETEIGHFIDKVWVTEGVRPGVVCCSHHIGRWRRAQDPHANRWATNTVRLERDGRRWRMSTVSGPQPSDSADPDTRRLWWRDGGVHQNITHAVHPDPLSGMHCWHQKVRVTPAGPDDRYGDVVVDLDKSQAVFREWLSWTRGDRAPAGLRRPLWFNRPLRPTDEAYRR
ncbi:MAG TPA: molybdopterin dinucleotide binding domain-containing protein [Planctomycetota bacterium]|nr:molybdopterin dinucleotide binding domain-containing protein [Planctomycetota bacterium]